MRVLKRTGEFEDVSFDKVLNRIKVLSHDLSVDIYDVSQKVCSRIFDGVKTSELDELAAHLCSSMVVDNPDYGVLASRLIVSNHHKNTSPSYSETIITLYNNEVEGERSPLISDTVYQVVMKNKEKLNSYIDYQRDYNFDYFGFKTLEKSYLIKINRKIIERPQHMFMRVALGIHGDDVKEALQTYDLMSRKYFTHATPTLFNAGTITPQNSSCYLQSMIGDSISSILETMKDCALISKFSGGIGLHVHNVRSKGSRIRSTNGESDGLVPMLKVFNHLGRYVNQCFVPDTMVYSEKGVIKMKDVKVGDNLLTFDFENNKSIMKPVLGIATSEVDKEILEILTSVGTDTVKVTKEHHLYVRKDRGQETEFIPASELAVGDFMAYPEKDGMFWFKVDCIESIPYKGVVYDFNMEDNHNYTVVNLGLVHNSGKRNGSIAIYLEPWHADIEAFLDLKKNHGDEEMRARDLFYALWIPDLFMQRVKEDGVWSLMCPDRCKGLSDVYGDEFIELYEQYEREGKYNKQVKAQDLWFKVLESQIETGVPYILYKDAANKKSNQKNLGTIKSSNLCVAGDTLILTSKGFHPIKDLHGKQVEVWNGEEFSATTIMKTGENQKLLKVVFDNRAEIKCTEYHKFYIIEEDREKVYEAKDLQEGMKIIPYILPDAPNVLRQVTITAIKDEGLVEDTYCFNEPKKHRGIFNGILAGNCCEIMEYSSPEETAVCNLSSICLPTYIGTNAEGNKFFDFDKLHELAMIITKNLNKIIDVNFYPIEKGRVSNLKHRPIGIGIQGLADTYILMGYPFDSPEAADLNRKIFETIYHGAVESSMLIAKKRAEYIAELNEGVSKERETEIHKYLRLNEFENLTGKFPGAYSTFEGSPASEGLLQFDLWNHDPGNDRYDWSGLKEEIKQWGIRNSLLLAPMPTASTSQIMGFTESFECITSNIYKRKTMAGEFVMVNKYLINDLIHEDLWNKDMKNKIMLGEGSIQEITEIPQKIRDLYKTAWEISQKVIIDQAADRGVFVCQSQSMNIFIEDPNFQKLTSMHFYGWNKGLKTGSYYIRTKPRAKVQQFTIDPTFAKETKKIPPKECIPDPETNACLMCSG